MSHDPGPWRVFTIANDGKTYGRWPDDGLSTDIYPAESDDYADRIASAAHVENAHLIAAAPEMLKALVDTLEYWETTGFADCEPDCNCIVDQVRAAIAKAKNEAREAAPSEARRS